MLDKLKAILADYVDIADIEITGDTVLIADLGLNSFDLVNLTCAVEDEFGIEIPDRAIKELKTVGDVMTFITSQ